MRQFHQKTQENSKVSRKVDGQRETDKKVAEMSQASRTRNKATVEIL